MDLSHAKALVYLFKNRQVIPPIGSLMEAMDHWRIRDDLAKEASLLRSQRDARRKTKA